MKSTEAWDYRNLFIQKCKEANACREEFEKLSEAKTKEKPGGLSGDRAFRAETGRRQACRLPSEPRA